jgi:adenylylsulfate kinase
MNEAKNIYPVFDRIIGREEKEKQLKQRSLVLWFTGLSGSGKTSIAVSVERLLAKEGHLTQILDGDNIRTGLSGNLGFSESDREENIRRIAETAKLFLNSGIITICCFVSPTEKTRSFAKKIIGAEDFVEVFVNTSLEECESRDVKGLYAKARKGELKDFTGISSPFEIPAAPEIEVNTLALSIEEAAVFIIKKISARIKL